MKELKIEINGQTDGDLVLAIEEVKTKVAVAKKKEKAAPKPQDLTIDPATAKMIERAGELVKKDWTLVKVARPEQDMRFDVPCIGTETVESVKKYNVCIRY